NSLTENTVRSISKDQLGNLWVGMRSKGLTVISKDGKHRQFKRENGNIHSIQNNYIKKVFSDSKGLIWIGSQTGVDYYDTATKVIHRIVDPAISNTAVFSILEDSESNLWFGTWNGLYKYIRKTGRLRAITPDYPLPHAHVWTVLLDSRKQLWVGTEGGGVAVLEQNGTDTLKSVKLLQHGSNGTRALSDNRVYCIFEDSKN